MNLNNIVKQFFLENGFHQLAKKILLIRHDGIPVYFNFDDSFEASSTGALVGGVWQAAQTLCQFEKNSLDFYDFRLGFDTTQSGIYILPVKIVENVYYLCAMYNDLDNPGKLKQKMRLLQSGLETFLSEFSLDLEQNRKGYLFDEISDDEMDNLFSFDGN